MIICPIHHPSPLFAAALNVDGHRPRRRVLLVWRADALVRAAPAAEAPVWKFNSVKKLLELSLFLLELSITKSFQKVFEF